MSNRANSIFESHSRYPTPWDCVCACPACLVARSRYIARQREKEDPTPPPKRRRRSDP